MSTYSDRVQVELTRAFERGQGHSLKLLQPHVAPTDQEDNVFNVRIKSRSSLLSAMVYGSKTYTAIAPNCPTICFGPALLRIQGELRDRDRFYINPHLLRIVRYRTLQVVRLRIIAEVVNIQGGAWAAKHKHSALPPAGTVWRGWGKCCPNVPERQESCLALRFHDLSRSM